MNASAVVLGGRGRRGVLGCGGAWAWGTEKAMVDCSVSGAAMTHRASGFLHSIDPANPPDALVAPLKPQTLRMRPAAAAAMDARASALGVQHMQIIVSDGFNPEYNGAYPGDEGNWSPWDTYVTNLATRVASNASPVQVRLTNMNLVTDLVPEGNGQVRVIGEQIQDTDIDPSPGPVVRMNQIFTVSNSQLVVPVNSFGQTDAYFLTIAALGTWVRDADGVWSDTTAWSDRTPPDASTSQTTLVRQSLEQAYDAGQWDGTGGIRSSGVTGTSGTTLGYAEAGAIGLTTFQGEAVDPLAALVRQTVSGDANLDGRLTADDFARLDRGFARHLTGSINGDFNYDNVVDAADYQIINAAWATQQGAVLASAAVGGRVAADVAALIPEPPVILLLGGAMILMLRRPQRLRPSERAYNAFR